MEQLALKYRPRRFADLVGQAPVQVMLSRMVAAGKVPPAILLDGPRGTGKTSTLRILAAALNCEASDREELKGEPCGVCASCKAVFDGSSLDLREIDAASHGLVEDIRQLRQDVLYATGGRYRVVGLDEAHNISRAGFNALLTVLEEPPPGTVFVLLTTEPGKILETVASRLMPFTFRRVTRDEITNRLIHINILESLGVDPELLVVLAERAQGGLRDAVVALDQCTRAGLVTLPAWTTVMGETDPGPRLLQAIRRGPGEAFSTLADILTATGDPAAIAHILTATLRDLCMLRAGGTVTATGSALQARQELAEDIGAGETVAAMVTLWNLKTRYRFGDDPRADLELAVAALADRLAPKAPTQTEAPERRLTLAELAAMGSSAVSGAGSGR